MGNWSFPSIYPIQLIKTDIDTKSEKYYIKINLHRNSVSDTSDMCEFKMALFYID